jgi:hypothetical protein
MDVYVRWSEKKRFKMCEIWRRNDAWEMKKKRRRGEERRGWWPCMSQLPSLTYQPTVKKKNYDVPQRAKNCQDESGQR